MEFAYISGFCKLFVLMLMVFDSLTIYLTHHFVA